MLNRYSTPSSDVKLLELDTEKKMLCQTREKTHINNIGIDMIEIKNRKKFENFD